MTTVDGSLKPLREALVRHARADAERELAQAKQDSEAELVKARAGAATILNEAAEAGRADASAVVAAERTAARRSARAMELAAQRELYEELRRRVATGVARLAEDPAVRDRFVAAVRARLGPDATVLDAAGGGVVGVASGRRVDLSLARLAERAVDALGGEVCELWAP